MQIKKRSLGAMRMCYAVAAGRPGGIGKLWYATEGNGECVAFSGEALEHRQTVWREPGGAMSLVPVPGTDADLLAIQKFYPVFQAAEAEIVWMRQQGATWSRHVLAVLPYVHRIEAIHVPGGVVLLASTLCAYKRDRDDWSCPGAVYAAVLPDEPRAVELKPILTGLTKNHGLSAVRRAEGDECLIAAEEGVFLLRPRIESGTVHAEVQQLIRTPASEAVLVDLDGCGSEELAVIEPFHGAELRVYKRREEWRLFYQHRDKLEFMHALWGGTLWGEPSLLVGHRAGNAALILLRFRAGSVEEIALDCGVGPANLAVLHMSNGDVVAAANHGSESMDIYFEGQTRIK